MREHLNRENYFSDEVNLAGLGRAARFHTVIRQIREMRSGLYNLVLEIHNIHKGGPDRMADAGALIAMQTGRAISAETLSLGEPYYVTGQNDEVRQLRHGVNDKLSH